MGGSPQFVTRDLVRLTGKQAPFWFNVFISRFVQLQTYDAIYTCVADARFPIHKYSNTSCDIVLCNSVFCDCKRLSIRVGSTLIGTMHQDQ